MIQPNPEIEVIINAAGENAKKYNHGYVTLEHLLHAIVLYRPFHDLLVAYGLDVNAVVKDINDFHDTASYLVSKELDSNPKKTHTLERVFNRALTQVLFAGRNYMQILDLFLSMLQENNNHACYFLFKHGLDKAKFIEFYQANYQEGRSRKSATKNRANEILKEFCDDLNEQARAGKIDPVIGREFELEEISHVLAKRNKSNILMVGDPGVGKTAIAEGLAKKIVDGEVPEYLKPFTVFNLDIGSLLAGSK